MSFHQSNASGALHSFTIITSPSSPNSPLDPTSSSVQDPHKFDNLPNSRDRHSDLPTAAFDRSNHGEIQVSFWLQAISAHRLILINLPRGLRIQQPFLISQNQTDFNPVTHLHAKPHLLTRSATQPSSNNMIPSPPSTSHLSTCGSAV